MRRTYRALYRIGFTPWDSDAIPAPVREVAERSTPGIGVDLGCGTGGQALFLASRGWQMTAVDYVEAAIERARERDHANSVRWVTADVTDPAAVDPDGELGHSVTLILDNGCLHGIPAQARRGWASTVERLAAPGCVLLVRAVSPGGPLRVGPAGIDEPELDGLIGSGWRRRSSGAAGWHRFEHA
ncbi:class I SAM-dependent methyltransferase [Gordonia rhizosphera]|nr:class I SAM-dependent methyltransferase [Gordonia rhizosphera]